MSCPIPTYEPKPEVALAQLDKLVALSFKKWLHTRSEKDAKEYIHYVNARLDYVAELLQKEKIKQLSISEVY
jgi:hypothetical protein